MKSRDVLHLFIQKHTSSFFELTTTEEQLELLIKEEFIKQFEIEEDNIETKSMFEKCNKSVFLQTYLSRFYKTRLLEYKERLDQVEL